MILNFGLLFKWNGYLFKLVVFKLKIILFLLFGKDIVVGLMFLRFKFFLILIFDWYVLFINIKKFICKRVIYIIYVL